MHRLKNAVHALGEKNDAAASDAIDTTIIDFDLADESVVPTWTIEMLDAFARGEPLGTWVSFTITGGEASDTLEFLRLLPEWLPVSYETEGERWTFRSRVLGRECIINFEASAYVIKLIGMPEPA